MTKDIILVNYLGKNIGLRLEIRKFLMPLDLKESLVLDFEGIEFVSRSCADEYLKFKENSVWIEKNVSEEVARMLKIVSKNRV